LVPVVWSALLLSRSLHRALCGVAASYPARMNPGNTKFLCAYNLLNERWRFSVAAIGSKQSPKKSFSILICAPNIKPNSKGALQNINRRASLNSFNEIAKGGEDELTFR
jgi:hypothetical protein